MNKAFVTLLIRSFRGGQATIAHYFYAISYYIIAVTGGGCFERTKISFIPFQGRIQRSAAITYPFEEQPDSTRQIHGRSR
jgi:beta-xylosidase